MAKKTKYYAVWKGKETGVFETWADCKKQVDGFDGAQYKSFETKQEAEFALKKNYFASIKPKETKSTIITSASPKHEALVVDAAWNTRTGDMEYQGLELQSKRLLFKKGPYFDGTNNIGEFLAIVHALALLKKNDSNLDVYTDSMTAMAWVRNKKAKTTLTATSRNAELFDLVERAEKWLKINTFSNKILKWETKKWGENPADFGRK